MMPPHLAMAFANHQMGGMGLGAPGGYPGAAPGGYPGAPAWGYPGGIPMLPHQFGVGPLPQGPPPQGPPPQGPPPQGPPGGTH